jgi:hypothetical protein
MVDFALSRLTNAVLRESLKFGFGGRRVETWARRRASFFRFFLSQRASRKKVAMRTIIRTTINQNVPGNRQDRLIKVAAGEVRSVALEQLRLFSQRALRAWASFSAHAAGYWVALPGCLKPALAVAVGPRSASLSGSASDPTRRCGHGMPVAAHASFGRG